MVRLGTKFLLNSVVKLLVISLSIFAIGCAGGSGAGYYGGGTEGSNSHVGRNAEVEVFDGNGSPKVGVEVIDAADPTNTAFTDSFGKALIVLPVINDQVAILVEDSFISAPANAETETLKIKVKENNSGYELVSDDAADKNVGLNESKQSFETADPLTEDKTDKISDEPNTSDEDESFETGGGSRAGGQNPNLTGVDFTGITPGTPDQIEFTPGGNVPVLNTGGKVTAGGQGNLFGGNNADSNANSNESSGSNDSFNSGDNNSSLESDPNSSDDNSDPATAGTPGPSGSSGDDRSTTGGHGSGKGPGVGGGKTPFGAGAAL